ncbi:Eco57I restriction-modification methylase domain-containing protein [Heyndrickxia camelliae]|uniref:site-specific DNA-methyltransferase (adenine-specific) n=1 Tax=Heyndrickxia camelliae TaxID=1707093 RepID=A0A2N3LH40_9BACI|nr:N-6 DNA methylase [Heyndrickxia camelliae]PKR83887.1 hypothetical protein CWO92_16655 [Heyndrickxia camelliae]
MNSVIEIKNISSRDELLQGLSILTDNINKIDELYQGDYYRDISEEDVEFLNDVDALSSLEPSTKMKVFHCFVEIISILVFKKVIGANEEITLNLPSSNIDFNVNEFLNIIDIEFKVGDYEKTHAFFETLYTDLVSSLSRKSSGTEFTSIQIVNFMLDEIGYNNNLLDRKLIDPSAGSGVFIITALERYLSDCKVSFEIVKQKLIEEKKLVAIDINPFNVLITKFRFILKLKEHFVDIDNDDIPLLLNEVPVIAGNTIEEPSLFNDCSPFLANNAYDYVIGNPPYIRLHRLPLNTREYIKDNFQSATGRFDLYVCFMEKAVNLLKDGGKISLITSNKFLTTNYGVGIRDFLLESTTIEHLVDLHDTQFFEAAVLPAILTATKTNKEKSDTLLYTSIKQSNNDLSVDKKLNNVFDYIIGLKLDKKNITEQIEINNNRRDMKVEISHAVVNTPKKNSTWNFSSFDEANIKSHIESMPHYKMKEVAHVCVGVKPNPNEVFVDPMTKQFVEERGFEQDVIFPILRKDNVDKWHVNWSEENKNDRYILYPHKMENGKGVAVDINLYPNVKRYIYEHEEILKSRDYLTKSKTRQWYEIWVPHDLEKFAKPKIVTKDISEKNNFALDTNGFICLGSIFWIYLKDGFADEQLTEQQSLYFLLGLCNSNVLEFYQKTISGSLYSKKVRYTSSNINKWIVPKVNNDNLNTVIEIVNTVSEILNGEDVERNESNLNQLVYRMFNLNNEQVLLIEQFLKTNS